MVLKLPINSGRKSKLFDFRKSKDSRVRDYTKIIESFRMFLSDFTVFFNVRDAEKYSMRFVVRK